MLRLIGLFDIPYTVKYIDRFCTIHDIGVCKYTSGRYVLCKYGNYYSSYVFSKRVMSCVTALHVRSNTFGRVEYIDHNSKITNDAYNTMINIFRPPPPMVCFEHHYLIVCFIRRSGKYELFFVLRVQLIFA